MFGCFPTFLKHFFCRTARSLPLALLLALPAAAQETRPLELRLTAGRIDGVDDQAVEQLRVGVQLIGADLGEVAPAVFDVPITPAELRELRWYLEDSWRWPSEVDAARIAGIEAAMRRWGEALWNGVFSGPQRLRVWQRFVDAEAGGRLVTVSSTDWEVLRLPWELLADPEGAYLFSREIAVRRRLPLPLPRPPRGLALPLRILMVVARPSGASFIDPRASARALLDGVETLGADNVEVELLHPPTFLALIDRLDDRRKPPVHVVHFDGHGTFDERRDVGSLIFEDAGGRVDAIDAERLGTLAQGVPLWVLDACESADVDTPDPFASVAPRLVEAGAGSVVAMQHSVLVDTTRRFFEGFYRTLAQGARIGEAMDAGRKRLFADPERFAFPRRPGEPADSVPKLALVDWFVPVLYQRDADPAPFAAATLPEADTQGALDDGFPVPSYRFVGRARELWQLERALRQRRVVVLHGLAGQGKTALASEAARWLRRTGLFQRILFVSLAGGGGRDAVVSKMGRQLEGANFAQRPRAEQPAAVLAALAQEPTLVVWDNAESVLPDWEHDLRNNLQPLLDFGQQLSLQGESRLLVTTRDPEIPHPAFRPSERAQRLALGELLPAEALELAGLVLAGVEIERRPPQADIEALLAFLGGHPLAIQLVVRQLPAYGGDARAVIRALEAIDPERPAGESRDRNASLDLSLSFSWQRLSEETRARLAPLGVFQGGALDFWVPSALGIEMKEWNDLREQVIGELVQAGLVRRDPVPFPWRAFGEIFGMDATDRPEVGQVSYYDFHPTLAPFLWGRLPETERGAVEERYRKAYYAFSDVLNELDQRRPEEARALAQRELPNLRRAFELTVEANEVDVSVDFGDNLNRFLRALGRWQEQRLVLDRLDALGRSASTPALSGPLNRLEYFRESERGEALLARGRAREAEAVFRRLLARMEEGGEPETGIYEEAATRALLARSLRSQGLLSDAEGAYRTALERLTSFAEKSRIVEGLIGTIHADLGGIALDRKHFDESRQLYEKALEISWTLHDHRGVAVGEGQLGSLALEQGDFDEARRRYTKALAAFSALDEPATVAIIRHQLGIVAQAKTRRASGDERLRLLDEAATSFKESLHIQESLGNHVGAGKSANQLAQVGEAAGRLASAERWYRKALEFLVPEGKSVSYASTASNLANLLLQVARLPTNDPRRDAFAGRNLLDEAKEWALASLEIREAIDEPSTAIWNTYWILAGIATARADRDAAAR